MSVGVARPRQCANDSSASDAVGGIENGDAPVVPPATCAPVLPMEVRVSVMIEALAGSRFDGRITQRGRSAGAIAQRLVRMVGSGTRPGVWLGVVDASQVHVEVMLPCLRDGRASDVAGCPDGVWYMSVWMWVSGVSICVCIAVQCSWVSVCRRYLAVPPRKYQTVGSELREGLLVGHGTESDGEFRAASGLPPA